MDDSFRLFVEECGTFQVCLLSERRVARGEQSEIGSSTLHR